MRKIQDVTILDSGRDNGKVFRITEMPAMKAEKWAMRALLAVGKSGVDIPDNVAGGGVAGLAAVGLKALMSIPWELAEPLLDEMMQCIQYLPDPNAPERVRPLIDDDIEEVKTRLTLRNEVFQLHTGFSLPGASSKSAAGVSGTQGQNSNGSATSPPQSAPLLRAARPV